jgi:hypothetical protein
LMPFFIASENLDHASARCRVRRFFSRW